MFKLFIHNTMFSENVRKIIDGLTEDTDQKPNPLGYVCLVSNLEQRVLKTMIFRAGVVTNKGVVWKSPMCETTPHEPKDTPEIDYELFKDRVSKFYGVEDEVGFRNFISAYVPRVELTQYHGHGNIQQLNMAYAQTMLCDQTLHDDFDDFLLNEDGTSKSSDTVMLSDDLRGMLEGKEYLMIGGSLFSIDRVGSAYKFNYVESDKVLGL
ncbi:hypothetical protein NVP1244A_136 [Vibrio phage 1.244.A._10N.261.54.C3]|nr:hypothetical protein NVP1244A_136 [Vibrio phage 1.244.A._10N.261.54.C3]AUR98764.1 hypothetical protein NVP1255O_136 [Vibrio phage 1.255.O._10N.286.45.F1]